MYLHSFLYLQFQFTPLREGLPGYALLTANGITFQFTPLREGLPDRHPPQDDEIDISIHAPARGASYWNLRHRII